MPRCVNVELNMKRHFTNAFLMPVKPMSTTLGPSIWCDSLLSDVSMHASFQVEDMLSICCELCIDNKKKPTVIKFGKYILNVFCQLYVKCYTVNVPIVECNLSINLKSHSFPDICLYKPLFCVKKSLSKFVQVFQIHPVCGTNMSLGLKIFNSNNALSSAVKLMSPPLHSRWL
jgi:hypothetical protein